MGSCYLSNAMYALQFRSSLALRISKYSLAIFIIYELGIDIHIKLVLLLSLEVGEWCKGHKVYGWLDSE